jgi:thioester reductase-like protein
VSRVLLTGATGFVGMEVLARYLERGDREVVALVRAPSDAEAAARMKLVLANLFGIEASRYADRVTALASELTAPRLGLSKACHEKLAHSVTTIVHSAASVSFSLPLSEARAINLEGTRRMLELASETRGLERYAHISTAYVAGTHVGGFRERDLDLGQEFRNSYEQSKFEAEQLVRSQPDIPFTILRPSIVVGDRRSGWTSAFNVLYWPLRAFARGLFTEVPALASAPVDVVSVDYVADAIHALCESGGGVGETFHLTAGANASTIQEIAHAASRYFKRPAPKVMAPRDFDGHAIEGGSAYFPYFSVATTFEDAFTRARLEPLGIRASPLGEYLERLLDFATRSRWGKRPIARVDALLA